ncbi:hypothetical protein [Pontimicrobium sp. MEBiC06410]
MKKSTNNIKGLIVYTTFMLEKINKLSIDQLKVTPKEAMIPFNEIVSVTTNHRADNNIIVRTINKETYYSNNSINRFIKKMKEHSELTFEKIQGGLAINIGSIKYKSNLALVELVNGDQHIVGRSFKARFQKAILRVWFR